MPLPHVDCVDAGGGGGVPPRAGGGGGDPAPRRLTLRTASRRRPVPNVVEAGRSPATSVLCWVIAVYAFAARRPASRARCSALLAARRDRVRVESRANCKNDRCSRAAMSSLLSFPSPVALGVRRTMTSPVWAIAGWMLAPRRSTESRVPRTPSIARAVESIACCSDSAAARSGEAAWSAVVVLAASSPPPHPAMSNAATTPALTSNRRNEGALMRRDTRASERSAA